MTGSNGWPTTIGGHARIRERRIAPAIRRLIAAAPVLRRRREAHDPAYRH